MGFPNLVRQHLYIDSAPRVLIQHNCPMISDCLIYSRNSYWQVVEWNHLTCIALSVEAVISWIEVPTITSIIIVDALLISWGQMYIFPGSDNWLGMIVYIWYNWMWIWWKNPMKRCYLIRLFVRKKHGVPIFSWIIYVFMYQDAVDFTTGHFNSLRPSDAIWRHRSGSTLAQVMACCLTAPSHYLNQCWLIC